MELDSIRHPCRFNVLEYAYITWHGIRYTRIGDDAQKRAERVVEELKKLPPEATYEDIKDILYSGGFKKLTVTPDWEGSQNAY